MSIISWGETPLISAIFSATDWIIGEQLRLPRQGSGAIYGQSVSRSSLSMGAACTASTALRLFLKVRTPVKPM